MTSLDTSKYILLLSDNHLFQTRRPKIPQIQAFMKCAPLLYPLLSFMEVLAKYFVHTKHVDLFNRKDGAQRVVTDNFLLV